MMTSPYLYIAGIITMLIGPLRLADQNDIEPWVGLAIDIVPSMLGFSMGGMAILLAFSDSSIFKFLAEEGKPESVFMQVVANFFHFILVQTLAVLVAIITSAHSGSFLSIIGCFLLVYAILIGVAIAGQLLNLAQVFNMAASLPDTREKQE